MFQTSSNHFLCELIRFAVYTGSNLHNSPSKFLLGIAEEELSLLETTRAPRLATLAAKLACMKQEHAMDRWAWPKCSWALAGQALLAWARRACPTHA